MNSLLMAKSGRFISASSCSMPGSFCGASSKNFVEEDRTDSVFVARAACPDESGSRPLGRGHPARALTGAGRFRDTGQDSRATELRTICSNVSQLHRRSPMPLDGLFGIGWVDSTRPRSVFLDYQVKNPLTINYHAITVRDCNMLVGMKTHFGIVTDHVDPILDSQALPRAH
jgi:hypothetical protein